MLFRSSRSDVKAKVVESPNKKHPICVFNLSLLQVKMPLCSHLASAVPMYSTCLSQIDLEEIMFDSVSRILARLAIITWRNMC